MRVYTSAVFAPVAFTLAALPVGAQEANTVEVIPYVALASGVASPIGAAITFPVTSKLDVEIDTAYRRAEGDIAALSLSASLLYDLPRIRRATPYVAAGVGLSQYGPLLSTSNRVPTVTPSGLAMTVNAGGGVKMPINDKFGLRTDARWFKLLGREGPSEGLRVSQGISFDTGKTRLSGFIPFSH
jgi:hypothetical protein